MFSPQIMGPTKALHSYDTGIENGCLCHSLGHCMLQLGTCQRLHVLPVVDKPWWKFGKILHRPSQQNGFTVSLLLQVKLILCSFCFCGLQTIIPKFDIKYGIKTKWGILYIAIWSHVLPKPRCVLLICLVVCCGGTFFIEQPRSSLMIEYHRMQWLARLIQVAWTYHDADPIYVNPRSYI